MCGIVTGQVSKKSGITAMHLQPSTSMRHRDACDGVVVIYFIPGRGSRNER
jgi:hypothetical protein